MCNNAYEGYDNTEEKTEIYAAKLCHDYSQNGYDDWFLPSKDEYSVNGYDDWYLPSKEEMRIVGLFLYSLEGFDFQNGDYMTSNEESETVAWHVWCHGDGYDYYADTNRDRSYYVYPIRYF